MASQAPAVSLDELQFRRPEIIQWWVSTMGGQPMDENMIHRYLAESPFFDHSTKNGLHFGQARTNAAEFDLVKDRRRFEDDLARHVGSEYMIVGEPREVQQGGGGSSGVWNIRKQQRDRRREDGAGRRPEELTTLGTYYLVGENMYQAPSVGDIVGNRLLSAASSLSKFFDTAAQLPTFSSTSGYTYLPPTSQPSAGAASNHVSPSRSREGSVIPGANADTQSQRSTSLAPPDSQLSSSTSTQDDRLLAQSFRMALEFNDEFMDENPVIGEPGHFTFTSSLAAAKKRKAAEDEAAALAAKAKEQKQTAFNSPSPSTAGGGKAEAAPGPPAVMTEAKMTTAKEKERRGSRMGEKARRKKSRAHNAGSLAAVSPVTNAGT